MNADRIFRFLPDPYRRAGIATAAHALTGAAADALDLLDRHAGQVLQSRFLEHLADLDDAERLAALFALTPWPEEELAEFRHRVRLMTRIYLCGAASAPRLLETVAAATDSVLKAVILPERPVPWTALPNDRYTTIGILARRADTTRGFTARVVDLPPVWQVTQVKPDSGYIWNVENSTYIDPNEEGFSPEPVVEVSAGEHPVSLPVLVQRDLRRFVLINRQIPPGATLRVDLRRQMVSDRAGPPTLAGPVYVGEEPAPDLLYGTAGLPDDTHAYRLTDPPPRRSAARPFHVLRWYREIKTAGDLPAVPGPPGTADPLPDGPLPWPPLVGAGTTHWRLMSGLNRHGLVPMPGERLAIDDLRLVPTTAALGPARLEFRWLGRQLATFTLLLPPQQLCDGPVAAGRMAHRADWLYEQIQRLKLAGMIYVDPAATALADPPEEGQPKQPEIALWEVTPPADDLEVVVKHLARKSDLKQPAELTDAVSITVTIPEKEE